MLKIGVNDKSSVFLDLPYVAVTPTPVTQGKKQPVDASCNFDAAASYFPVTEIKARNHGGTPPRETKVC